MTKQADFKRRVRARMAKTGESYATARSQLLAEQPMRGRWPGRRVDGGGVAREQRRRHGSAGTGLAERVLYWRDVLHEGPVPAVGPRSCAGSGPTSSSGGLRRPRRGRRMFVERDRVLAANRDGEYVLWFEADLYDQLQIIQILARLADLGVPAQRITLICIGEHPGIARFGGLGELTAEQLRELPATNACARLTPAALRARHARLGRLPRADAGRPGRHRRHPLAASCGSWARRSTGSAASTRPPATGCR